MSERNIVSKEEFERAYKRLAELNAELNTLIIQHIFLEDEQSVIKWVIKNHKEVEQLSKTIENYGQKK
jgi:anion-transporting  ArsA/GET3 family ATPase